MSIDCMFDWMLYVPVNNFSVVGGFFLGGSKYYAVRIVPLENSYGNSKSCTSI